MMDASNALEKQQKHRTKLTFVLLGIIGITLLILFVFYRQEFGVSKFSSYCGLLSFIPLLLFTQFTNAKSRKFPLLGLFLLMMSSAIGLWAFVKDFDQIGNDWGYSVVWLLSLLIAAIVGAVMLYMLIGGGGARKGEHIGDIYKTGEDKYEIHINEKQ